MILDGEQMRRALVRMAHEILERHGGTDRLLLVGIPHARGTARPPAG